MNEKISILIPAFNRERYIAEAITSAQNQTYENIKIFVFDDGSKDSTVSIVKRFSTKDSRICLIEGKENRGVGYARNCLLEVCDTEYACWLDSDDVLNIYRVEIQYENIKDTNHIVFCRASRFRNNLEKRIWKTHPSKLSLKACDAQIASMFLVEKASKYSEKKITGGEDTCWNHMMAKEFSVLRIPEVLYYIRVHSERISSWSRKLRRIPVDDRKGKSYRQLINLYNKQKGN